MCSFWNALTSLFPQWINTCGFLSELQLCLVQTQSLRAAPAQGPPMATLFSQGTSASKVPDPPGPLAGQRHVAAVTFSFWGSKVTFCASQGPAHPSRGAHEVRLQPAGERPPSPVSSHCPGQPSHRKKQIEKGQGTPLKEKQKTPSMLPKAVEGPGCIQTFWSTCRGSPGIHHGT